METNMTVAKPSETRKTRGAAPRTRTRAPRAAPRSGRSARVVTRQPVLASLDADGTIAALAELKSNLDATRDKLQLVDPKRLSDEEFKAFALQSHQVNLAINAASNAELGALSAKFKAELPAINAATGQLKTDLQRLKDSVAIIQAVASVLGVIENVAKLLA
jgi:hypothetical protein